MISVLKNAAHILTTIGMDGPTHTHADIASPLEKSHLNQLAMHAHNVLF